MPAVLEPENSPLGSISFYGYCLKIWSSLETAKGKILVDKTCCTEDESVTHLFFDCVVAEQIWTNISRVLEIRCGGNFESVGKLWISNKRHLVVNAFTCAALWGLWKLRNLLCFQNGLWQDVPNVLWKIAGLIHNWRILYPSEKMQELELPQIRKAEILSKTTWKIRELAEI